MNKLGKRLAITFYRTKFKVLSAVSKKKAAQIAFELFCTPQFHYKRTFPKNFQKAEKLELDLSGTRVKGYRWNKGGHRRVLIAHGFNSTVLAFDAYILPLLKKGYEIIAFDAPGHGYSQGKTINAVVYKEMILAVNNAFGPIQSFMAHSFGGLAVGLALEEIPHDDQFRVVLLAPATETTTAIDFFCSFVRLNKAVREEFDQLIFKLGHRPPEWFSLARIVPGLKANIRWYHDENDEITPFRDAKKVMDQNYSHVEFVVTKGLGHRRIYRDREVAKAVVEFL